MFHAFILFLNHFDVIFQIFQLFYFVVVLDQQPISILLGTIKLANPPFQHVVALAGLVAHAPLPRLQRVERHEPPAAVQVSDTTPEGGPEVVHFLYLRLNWWNFLLFGNIL